MKIHEKNTPQKYILVEVKPEKQKVINNTKCVVRAFTRRNRIVYNNATNLITRWTFPKKCALQTSRIFEIVNNCRQTGVLILRENKT